MFGMEKFVFVLGVLCAVAVLPGCRTTETTTTTTYASSAATASTESVAVSVSTETTTATRSTTPPPPPPPAPAVDVLSDAKKPCGTVAADAPKFVKPETKK